MSEQSTSRTGHQDLDLPGPRPHRYHTPYALPIFFLYKMPTPEREDILQQIVAGSTTASSKDNNRPIGIVPWLRSFTPTTADIVGMGSTLAIYIDRTMLKKGMCIACHGLIPQKSPSDTATYEFASAKISEAYDLVTNTEWGSSWFPQTLPESAKLDFPVAQEQYNNKEGNAPKYESDMPVIVVVDLTEAQHEQLYQILDSEMASVTLIDIPNTTSDLDDIDHLMEYFLEQSWFPGDFAVIDAQTVAELSALNKQNSTRPDADNITQTFPSFLLATSLQIWHHASDDQHMAIDEVGYAVARRQMEHEEEFSDWCVHVFRGMGLRRYIGWEEGDEEGIDWYYWSCWLDKKGRVDGETRGEARVRY